MQPSTDIKSQIQTRKSKLPNCDFTNTRNELIITFFQKIGFHVVLTGDANNPSVIYNNQTLSLYVHNFRLHFLDKPLAGKDLYICRVDEPRPDIELLVFWFKKAQHKKAFRIRVTNTPLMVCGIGSDGKPVFGTSKIHYYHSQEFALHLLEKFDLQDYCEII